VLALAVGAAGSAAAEGAAEAPDAPPLRLRLEHLTAAETARVVLEAETRLLRAVRPLLTAAPGPTTASPGAAARTPGSWRVVGTVVAEGRGAVGIVAGDDGSRRRVRIGDRLPDGSTVRAIDAAAVVLGSPDGRELRLGVQADPARAAARGAQGGASDAPPGGLRGAPR
jgi:hypothetical protein